MRFPALSRPVFVTGAVMVVVVFLLGLLARVGAVARADLRVDEHIATHDRTSALTAVAKAASTLATPENIGPAILAAIVLLLLALRRWSDAVLVVGIALVAVVLLEIGKKVIGEPRPPASLWLMSADNNGSYPSGHVTIAAVIAIALVIAAGPAWRVAAAIAGGLFALIVAFSRVYLGDHYPLDVLGGIGCAAAAACLVASAAAKRRRPVAGGISDQSGSTADVYK